MSFTRRHVRKLAGVATAAAVGLGLSATVSVAQDVTLRMHQFLPAQANVPKNILIPWLEKVEAESEGRIKIDHFGSMQLGGRPPELISQAIDGVADIVWTLPGYTPGRFPHTEVFELPFMMTNAEAASAAVAARRSGETHMSSTRRGERYCTRLQARTPPARMPYEAPGWIRGFSPIPCLRCDAMTPTSSFLPLAPDLITPSLAENPASFSHEFSAVKFADS